MIERIYVYLQICSQYEYTLLLWKKKKNSKLTQSPVIKKKKNSYSAIGVICEIDILYDEHRKKT